MPEQRKVIRGEKPDEQYQRSPELDAEVHLQRLIEEYKKSKEALEQLEKRQNLMKKELTQAIEEKGYTDDKGHVWLKVGPYEIKRERRVSRSFDTKAAEDWARANGMWDSVKEVIEVLSEERLLALAWEDKSLNETVSTFYVEKETWAFKA